MVPEQVAHVVGIVYKTVYNWIDQGWLDVQLPDSPQERGSDENRNRVLRRFIPKDQAIEELSDHKLVQINWYLNSRPLKCLNWHTPIEIFLLNLRH